MKRILITGGTGFVASHLVERLVELGETDLHLTSYRDEGAFVKKFVSPDRIHQINLADYQATQDLIKEIQPEQVYHLASIASVGDSFLKRKAILDINNNLQLNLLEAIKTHAPQARLLHISTALVYAHSNQPLDEMAELGPDNPYALSKLTQEMMAYSFWRSEGLDVVRVRPFNHIGERQTLGFVIADLAANIVRIERGEQSSLQVGNLESVRDFSDVQDIVEAYILLMNRGQRGTVYNVGSGQGQSIQAMLDMLIGLAHSQITVKIDPQKIRPVDLPYLVCDNKKIMTLDWRPKHQLTETLERILNYWRENL